MWSFYKNCIFCHKELIKNLRGDGEHVIPANVFGFWRSYDVCDECIKYFGSSNIDKLAIKNPSILESMDKLKVDSMEGKYEQMPFYGKDVELNGKVFMIRRNRKYKVKVKRVENRYLECSEDDFEKAAIPFLKDQRYSIPIEELNKEIENIKDKYIVSIPGESIHSDLLRITLIKRQVSNIEYDSERIPSITPLIAKIVFIAIHYFVPNLLSSFRNYWEFRDHARFEKPINESFINPCYLRKGDIRLPFHMIRFLGGGYSLMVDCVFFGYNNWRSILYCNKEIILTDAENKKVETISFYMDFGKTERKKYVELLYPDGNKLLLPAQALNEL